ncbi:MAG: hypothetical protein ACREVE_17555 [Gammaproteobacteria bacterium]
MPEHTLAATFYFGCSVGTEHQQPTKAKQYTPYCIHQSSFYSIAPQASGKFELHALSKLAPIADVVRIDGGISMSMRFYFNSYFLSLSASWLPAGVITWSSPFASA